MAMICATDLTVATVPSRGAIERTWYRQERTNKTYKRHDFVNQEILNEHSRYIKKTTVILHLNKLPNDCQI